MTDLSLTIPFAGRIYINRDLITLSRYTVEVLHSPCGRELLLCCGSLRVYLTPTSSLTNEAHQWVAQRSTARPL